MPKDNVLTLKVPGANLVFTRYLYIKDEVKTSLLVSILNKSDDAIFWAYELYYSGFKNELIEFIWQIYYDFFATRNPTFAAYLSKKLGQGPKDDRLISSIIQNLLIRNYNTDVFLLRTISEVFVSDAEAEAISGTESSFVTVETLLLNEDYRGLANYILNNKERKLEEEIEIYKSALNYFKLTNQEKRIIQSLENKGNSSTILLANIMSLINSEQNLIKKKINFYVRVNPEEVVQYETIEASTKIKSYRILRHGCTTKIENSWANLFEGFRNQIHNFKEKDKYNEWTTRAVLEKYSDNWLYHAAFSPEWFDRIRLCKGYIDYVNQKVKFVSDDWEDTFNNRFNLDPDEQSLIVKNNALKRSEDKSNWQQFFAKYKNCGLVDALDEELDALNEMPLKY
jgi:hypothetical protein